MDTEDFSEGFYDNFVDTLKEARELKKTDYKKSIMKLSEAASKLILEECEDNMDTLVVMGLMDRGINGFINACSDAQKNGKCICGKHTGHSRDMPQAIQDAIKAFEKDGGINSVEVKEEDVQDILELLTNIKKKNSK